MSALEEEEGLCDLDPQTFVARIAHYYCEIYVLHPFRAGNGRAQRIFSNSWLHAGYLLNWDTLEPESWHQPSSPASAAIRAAQRAVCESGESGALKKCFTGLRAL